METTLETSEDCYQFIETMELHKAEMSKQGGSAKEREEAERSKVDEIRGTPWTVGTLEEMIDENHAIVSTQGGGGLHSARVYFFRSRSVLLDPVHCGQGAAGAWDDCPLPQQVPTCSRYPPRRGRPSGQRDES